MSIQSILAKTTACTALSFTLALSVSANAEAGDRYRTYSAAISTSTKTDTGSGGVTFLPRDVSQSLQISRIPTSEPVPLIVGTYWNCDINDQGFEICDTITVVCNDDQSFCTQIP